MMTNDDERGGGVKKCLKFDDVICERPLIALLFAGKRFPFVMWGDSKPACGMKN